MFDSWVSCTCTTARIWGESLASSSNWLAALVTASGVRANGASAVCAPTSPDNESRSASYGAARGSTLDTTTTRIPALSPATRSS